MSNEEKILSMLETLVSDVSELKQGQAKLEQGQEELKHEVSKLKQGQTELKREVSDCTAVIITVSKQVDALTEKHTEYDRKFDRISKAAAI